jgi:hypothetical protein
MDDIMDRLMGIDKKNEIFNLWYEINFLRLVVNEILSLNPELHKNLNEESFQKCRKQAQDIVRVRFPGCNITFNPIESEEITS